MSAQNVQKYTQIEWKSMNTSEESILEKLVKTVIGPRFSKEPQMTWDMNV